MAEAIVNAQYGTSKSVDQFRGEDFDLVITVYDAAAENCPIWLRREEQMHLGFPDPAKTTGSEEEIIIAFRRFRNDMLVKIPPLLK
jgi:arsenate reductase